MKQFRVHYNVYNSQGHWFMRGMKVALAQTVEQAEAQGIRHGKDLYERQGNPVTVKIITVLEIQNS